MDQALVYALAGVSKRRDDGGREPCGAHAEVAGSTLGLRDHAVHGGPIRAVARMGPGSEPGFERQESAEANIVTLSHHSSLLKKLMPPCRLDARLGRTAARATAHTSAILLRNTRIPS